VSFPGNNVRILSNGDFVWFSERSGWGHLYLYDGKTGRLKKQLTRGDWVVYDIVGVDEEAGVLYILGAGKERGRNPYYRHFYRVALDGSGTRLLTPENMDHAVPSTFLRAHDAGPSQPVASVSPSGRFFVERLSTVDTLAKTVLRTTDGELVMALETADPGELVPEHWVKPMAFSAKAADGTTDIYGNMYFPTNFDASKKYPVIDYSYSAPFYIDVVTAPFDVIHFIAQGMAELGFVVVQVHSRGTPGRSKAFQDYSYNNLQTGPGLEDHVAAIRRLAERYSYIDIDRIGIVGFSSGGYNTVLAMLDFPDFFKVGVAGAPGIDYVEVVRIVTERWQGPPGEDRVNYQGLTLANKAKQLKGKLLFAFGDLDENAPPGPMVRFIDALTAADRNYDLILMPNHTHGFAIDPYFQRRRADYLVEHLMGSEPPDANAVEQTGALPENDGP
jgi:dipeptidyl aminopeptidase/acylaminoacyl peptidase